MTRRVESLDDAIDLAKEEVGYHHDLFAALQETGDSQAAARHLSRQKLFESLVAFIQSLAEKQRGNGLGLLPEDLEGLPPEVIQELSLTDSDQQEIDILRLMEAEGGTISLDLLIVRWYRAKKELIRRRTLNSRLYRMQQKGRVFALPGTKGVYSLHRPQGPLEPITAEELEDEEPKAL